MRLGANLNNEESLSEIIAKQEWSRLAVWPEKKASLSFQAIVLFFSPPCSFEFFLL
jgi:hypothetical protein